MQLTLWTYEGPPHIGAMRVATGMSGLHFVLHAPQGDTYADLLFTMIERRARAPAGHLHHLPGARSRRRHGRIVQDRRARRLRAVPAAGDDRRRLLHRRTAAGRSRRPRPRARPALPGHPARTVRLFRRRRTGARRKPSIASCARSPGQKRERAARERPSGNLLGPTALGFRHRDDVLEITELLGALGVDVSVTAPLGATPDDLTRLGDADFNVVLYPEIALPAAQ